MRFEDLNTYRVYFPLLAEQIAIANYLDEKTAQIDNVANMHKLIELLKEKRAALINEAVTKGLNYDSRDSQITMINDKKNPTKNDHGNHNNQINHSAHQ